MSIELVYSREDNGDSKPYPYLIPPEMGIKLVGVIGKAGSGKDTFIDEIIHTSHKDVFKVAFAAALKDACAAAFGIGRIAFDVREIKEVQKEFWGVSPREIGQFVGTEFFRHQIDNLLREKVGSDFWVKRLYGSLIGALPFYDYNEYINICDVTVFISDVRFQNEVDFIVANKGSIVEIVRPSLQGVNNVVGIPNHESEKLELSILVMETNYRLVINDRGLDELKSEALDYAKCLKLI